MGSAPPHAYSYMHNIEIATLQGTPLIAENDSDETSNSSYKRSMELNSSVLNEIVRETLKMRNSIDRLNQKFAVQYEENQCLLNRSIDKSNRYEFNQHILYSYSYSYHRAKH